MWHIDKSSLWKNEYMKILRDTLRKKNNPAWYESNLDSNPVPVFFFI